MPFVTARGATLRHVHVVAEYRRYVARDLERARERLRAESEDLAARGLRPTWTLWVRKRRRWRRRRGELTVCLEPIPTGESSAAARSALLAPLVWKARSLVAAQKEATRQLDALTPSEAGDEPAVEADRGRELESFRRRLEVLSRELELELTRLESLCDR